MSEINTYDLIIYFVLLIKQLLEDGSNTPQSNNSTGARSPTTSPATTMESRTPVGMVHVSPSRRRQRTSAGARSPASSGIGQRSTPYPLISRMSTPTPPPAPFLGTGPIPQLEEEEKKIRKKSIS